VFFSLQNFFSCYETQQLILGTGTAIWWVTEPHLLGDAISIENLLLFEIGAADDGCKS
jgi:hypothetical protein